jgi:RimJ/RimL family protein N-acetyltransferase
MRYRAPVRLETRRLTLRRLSVFDADFIVQLLNDLSFLRYIGDKGVRTRADARRYIQTGPIDSYQHFGFGPYLVELEATQEPIGICGLRKRESLSDPDLGFAFLPEFREQGYAFESAAAVLAHAREVCGLERIVAITAPDNHASIHLLGKLGFSFERMAVLSEDGPEVRLFASHASLR